MAIQNKTDGIVLRIPTIYFFQPSDKVITFMCIAASKDDFCRKQVNFCTQRECAKVFVLAAFFMGLLFIAEQSVAILDGLRCCNQVPILWELLPQNISADVPYFRTGIRHICGGIVIQGEMCTL